MIDGIEFGKWSFFVRTGVHKVKVILLSVQKAKNPKNSAEQPNYLLSLSAFS